MLKGLAQRDDDDPLLDRAMQDEAADRQQADQDGDDGREHTPGHHGGEHGDVILEDLADEGAQPFRSQPVGGVLVTVAACCCVASWPSSPRRSRIRRKRPGADTIQPRSTPSATAATSASTMGTDGTLN